MPTLAPDIVKPLVIDPVLDGAPEDSFEDAEPEHTHIVNTGDLVNSQVTGEPATALCGKRWIPRRDPDKYPLCQRCVERFNKLHPVAP